MVWDKVHIIYSHPGLGPFPPGGGLAYPNLTDVWGNVSTFSNHVNDRAIVSNGKELSRRTEWRYYNGYNKFFSSLSRLEGPETIHSIERKPCS